MQDGVLDNIFPADIVKITTENQSATEMANAIGKIAQKKAEVPFFKIYLFAYFDFDFDFNFNFLNHAYINY
jgi:hypothetical protein